MQKNAFVPDVLPTWLERIDLDLENIFQPLLTFVNSNETSVVM